jgi:hypothetical protein
MINILARKADEVYAPGLECETENRGLRLWPHYNA